MRTHDFHSFDGVRLRAVEAGDAASAGAPVVLCFPPCLDSHAFFDCPVADYSLMSALASRGFRGSEAGITSEADSLEFLALVGGPMRALDVLDGAGALPSLEAQRYRRVQADIAWFLDRRETEAR